MTTKTLSRRMFQLLILFLFLAAAGCEVRPPLEKEGLRSLTTDGHQKGLISWLNNDEIVYSVNRDGSWDLMLLTVGTGSTHTIYEGPGNAREPDCSPDGLQIVFVESPEEGPERLSVMSRFPDWTVSELAYTCEVESSWFLSPSWSRDSGSIAVSRPWHSWDTSVGVIYVIDILQGCHFLYEGNYEGIEGTSWSNLNSRIAYSDVSEDGSRSIYTFDSDGSEMTRITSAYWDNDPDWSPNDTHLCFTSSRAGTHDIWITRVDATGSLKRLTDDVFLEFSPCWSPDGSSIAFVSDHGDGDDIWLIPVPSLP